MTDLRECPFCGGEAKIVDGLGVFWVACESCGATTRLSEQDEAREAWNRRIEPAPKPVKAPTAPRPKARQKTPEEIEATRRACLLPSERRAK